METVMAHQMYNAGRTAMIAGDVMGAGRAQARLMLDGAAALRVATVRADASLKRLAASKDRLACAKAARAVLKG